MESSITNVDDSYHKLGQNGVTHLFTYHSTHNRHLLWAQANSPSLSKLESYAQTLIDFDESNTAPNSTQPEDIESDVE